MTLPTVLLLDLDGVLVAPLGYRAAIQAVLSHTFRRWAWPLTPPADLPEHFEAAGVSSEWDIVPLAIATALEAWSAAHKTVPPPKVLEADGPSPGKWGSVPSPNFAATAAQLAPHLQPGEVPAASAWRLQHTPHALFPHLGTTPLAEALLAHTRDVLRSPLTRLFQHFTLGSEGFTQTYGQQATMPTPSLLRRHDVALLSPKATSWLCETRRADSPVKAAVFTARPSLPPRNTPFRPGYAPEAELALEVMGCPALPMIGFGRLQALAEDTGQGQGEHLLKPAPFHALAALLAALNGDEARALREAFHWLHSGELPPTLSETPIDHLIVIEDTRSGMQAALDLQRQLRARGFPFRLTLLGIADHTSKRHSLQSLGARVFSTTDAAFEFLVHTLTP